MPFDEKCLVLVRLSSHRNILLLLFSFKCSYFLRNVSQNFASSSSASDSAIFVKKGNLVDRGKWVPRAFVCLVKRGLLKGEVNHMSCHWLMQKSADNISSISSGFMPALTFGYKSG